LSSTPRQQLESWVGSLDIKADRVLDVGGSQKPAKGRTASWDVEEYLISDIEVPHDNSSKPDIVFDLGERSLDKECMNYFDTIFCLEVSEYVKDPVAMMNNLNWRLNNGGKLYISFNFSYPVHNPPGLDYFRYTRFGVKQLLENNGFNIDKLIPRTCDMNTGYPQWMEFISKQGMKYSKELGDINRETGYLVEATKL